MTQNKYILLLITFTLFSCFFLDRHFDIFPSFRYGSFQEVIKLIKINSTRTKDNIEQTSAPFPPINFSTPLARTTWIIKKTYSASNCLQLARKLPLWNIMCVSDNEYPSEKYENLIRINTGLIEYTRQTHNLTDLTLQETCYAIAIKLGATVIYTSGEDGISADMTHRLETLSTRGSVRYTGVNDSFDTSFYYGCNSPKVSNVTENDHRRPLFCDQNNIAGISTPALFPPLQDTTACDSSMPDISMSENSYLAISFSASIFERCAFYFLPLTDDAFVNSPHYEKYCCVIQHLMRWAGCRVSVHWAGSDSRVKYATVSRTTCLEVEKNLPSCETTNVNECVAETLKVAFSEDARSRLEQWIDVLETLNFTQQRIGKLKENCSQIIWYPKKLIDNGSFENNEAINDHYKKTCFENGTNNFTKVELSKPWFQRPNIVMLVIFNRLYTDILPLIEVQYRPFYPNIVYCADSLPRPEDIWPYRANFFTYVQKFQPGSLHYYCYLKAIKMGLKTDGILGLNDDVFMKTDIIRFPLNKLWYHTKDAYRLKDMDTMMDCHENFTCNFDRPWMWWKKFKSQIFNFFDEIDKQTDFDLIAMRNQLISATKSKHRLFGAISDTLFLPKIYFTNFTKIVSILLKSQVFLEIAIPTAMRSMEPIENIHSLKTLYKWTPDRMQPWKFMNNATIADAIAVHPVKLKPVIQKHPPALEMFCRCMIPYFHDPNVLYLC